MNVFSILTFLRFCKFYIYKILLILHLCYHFNCNQLLRRNRYEKKILWIIIGIAIILLLIIAAFIVKQVNGSGKKDSEGYDTYTVKKETPISLEGKASPKSVKHIIITAQLGHF